MKKPRRVEVEWDDTWSDSQAVTADSNFYERPYLSFVCGYLKSKGKRVVVALCWEPELEDKLVVFRRCVSIPRRAVRRITYLEEK